MIIAIIIIIIIAIIIIIFTMTNNKDTYINQNMYSRNITVETNQLISLNNSIIVILNMALLPDNNVSSGDDIIVIYAKTEYNGIIIMNQIYEDATFIIENNLITFLPDDIKAIGLALDQVIKLSNESAKLSLHVSKYPIGYPKNVHIPINMDININIKYKI